MCGRIQNAVGIMVLNHWEVMWTVGRNDLFHYAVPNIWNTSARGLLLPKPCPILTFFFPQLLKDRPAILQNDYYLPFSRNQQLESTVQWIVGVLQLHSFTLCLFSAAAQNLKQKTVICFLWDMSCEVFINGKHSPSCLMYLFTSEYWCCLFFSFFIKPLGPRRQHF